MKILISFYYVLVNFSLSSSQIQMMITRMLVVLKLQMPKKPLEIVQASQIIMGKKYVEKTFFGQRMLLITPLMSSGIVTFTPDLKMNLP